MTASDRTPPQDTPADAPADTRGIAGTLRRWALALPLAPVAIIAAILIITLGVFGYREDSGAAPALFDLDGEGKPPAAFSALLLGSAGIAGLLNARDTGERAWGLLGAFLIFMAVDEAITLHETLAEATGVGWIKLYLPVVAVGGLAWLAVWRKLWSQRLLWFGFAAGAAAWFVSQVLESLQSNDGGRVENYSVYSTFEETLELTGSALWLLVLVAALQWRPRRSS